MKKCLIGLIFLLMLISSCTVNQFSGLLIITNTSNTTINNLSIDNNYILLSLAPGATYDYWYFIPLEGRIITDNNYSVNALKYDYQTGIPVWIINPSCHFKLSYQYEIEIKQTENKYMLYVNRGVKTGIVDESTYDYPVL